MARRSKCPELEVRASFEAGRIAPQCLAEVNRAGFAGGVLA